MSNEALKELISKHKQKESEIDILQNESRKFSDEIKKLIFEKVKIGTTREYSPIDIYENHVELFFENITGEDICSLNTLGQVGIAPLESDCSLYIRVTITFE